MVNADGDHLKAGSIGLTGMLEGKTAEVPNFSSVVARHRGEKELPAFMAIGRNPQDMVGPTRGFGCSMSGETARPALQLLDGFSPAALDDRRKLLGGFDRVKRGRRRGSATRCRWGEQCRQIGHPSCEAMLPSPDRDGNLLDRSDSMNADGKPEV
jgi:hypothetical protein